MRILLLCLLVACADGDPTPCAERDVADCSGDCTTIDGRAMQDDGAGGTCVDFTAASEPIACMDAGSGCTTAETLAAPPGDPAACTWFSSGCIPEGWTSCGEMAANECRG